MKNKTTDVFGKTISRYTRAQAIEDGVLVDISNMASKIGFKIPIAVTDTVWKSYAAWSHTDTEQQTYQDTDGRLRDILFMLRFAMRKNRNTRFDISYKLYIVPKDGKTKKAKLTELKAVLSAGDDGEPVITIMSPNED